MWLNSPPQQGGTVVRASVPGVCDCPKLAGQAGLEGFSTRKLGKVLGCEAMGIYHLFPGKSHLMNALLHREGGAEDRRQDCLEPRAQRALRRDGARSFDCSR